MNNLKTIYQIKRNQNTKDTLVFADVFKFLRLKAGFKTILEFNRALARKNFKYDNSLISHWQRGSRVPRNRKLILAIISVFLESGFPLYEEQANILLISTNTYKLKNSEIIELKTLKLGHDPNNFHIQIKKFIENNNRNKKLKLDPQMNKKTNHRFNLIISSNIHKYLNDISQEKNMSKADFLRKLIYTHIDDSRFIKKQNI